MYYFECNKIDYLSVHLYRVSVYLVFNTSFQRMYFCSETDIIQPDIGHILKPGHRSNRTYIKKEFCIL